jgi:hypothetical protein
MDKIPHIQWRVADPRNVTARKRLFSCPFVVIWTALTSVLLRKGEGQVGWAGLRFLELECARSVGKKVWSVVGVVRGHRTKWGTASHEGRM